MLLAIWHWFLAVTGTHIPPGQYSNWYNFFSGFGSDLGEVAIVGGLIQIYRKHNCHQKGCWRIGKHSVGHYVVCSKHHPGVPKGDITAKVIKQEYNRSINKEK